MSSEADALLKEWRQQSLAQAWRFAADWLTPLQEQLVAELLSSAATADETVEFPAVLAFGTERAKSGIGLGETVSDFLVLLQLVEAAQPHYLVRILCEGWVAGSREHLDFDQDVDPSSGLISASVLVSRLREAWHGVDQLEPMAAVVWRLSGGQPDEWTAVALGALGGAILAQVFGPGAMLASCDAGAFLALVPVGSVPPALPQELASRLDTQWQQRHGGAADPASQVKVFELPADARAALEVLETICLATLTT